MSAQLFQRELWRGTRTRANARQAIARARLETLERRTLLSFAPAPDVVEDSNLGRFSDAATADLNSDGKSDLAATHIEGVSLWFGNGDGTFSTPITFPAGPSYSAASVTVANVNNLQDAFPDLVITNSISNSPGFVTVLFGNGVGGFSSSNTTDAGGLIGVHPRGAAVGDFNGDGRSDVAVTNAGSNTVTVIYGDGGVGSIVAVNQLTGGSSPQGIVAADLNGDGLDDLAIANRETDSVEVLLGFTGGAVIPMPEASGAPFAANDGPSDIAVGDVNGDGKLDVVVGREDPLSSVTADVSILSGNGDGTLGAPGAMTVAPLPTGVGLADVDLDGDDDIVATHIGGVYLLVSNGDGSFQPKETIGVAAGDVIAGDFNGDTYPDLALPEQFNGPQFVPIVKILLNVPPAPPPAPPTMSISDVTRNEGSGKSPTAFTFTVTLSAASSEAVTVNYATSNGTANAGSDYQAAAGTLTFAPGETVKTITVLVQGDKASEGNETFFLDLLGASSNASIDLGRGIGLILNDDGRGR